MISASGRPSPSAIVSGTTLGGSLLAKFPVLFPCWQGIGLDEAFAVRGLPEHFQARFDRREIFSSRLWRGVRSRLSPQPSSLAFWAFSVRRGRKPGNSAFLVSVATPEKAEPSQSRHRIPRFLRRPLACSGLGRSRSRPAGLSLVTRSQAGAFARSSRVRDRYA